MCACINPWPTPASAQTVANYRKVTFNRQLHHGVRAAKEECVPLDYGASTCRAWDPSTNQALYTGQAQPDWCAARWCYVNATTSCERPTDLSNIADDRPRGSSTRTRPGHVAT